MIKAESGHRTNWFLVMVAAAVLFGGAMVYVLDRPADSVPFFSAISLNGLFPSVFGRIGEHLPTFCHVLAFSLLTAACLGGDRRRAARWACLSWFGIDTTFEAGQHPRIAEHIVAIIPDCFETLPILEHADAYFLAGTFDAWDLLSIAAGAAAAYSLISCTAPKDDPHG